MPLDGCGHRRHRIIPITAVEPCRGQPATITLIQIPMRLPRYIPSLNAQTGTSPLDVQLFLY